MIKDNVPLNIKWRYLNSYRRKIEQAIDSGASSVTIDNCPPEIRKEFKDIEVAHAIVPEIRSNYGIYYKEVTVFEWANLPFAGIGTSEYEELNNALDNDE